MKRRMTGEEEDWRRGGLKRKMTEERGGLKKKMTDEEEE